MRDLIKMIETILQSETPMLIKANTKNGVVVLNSLNKDEIIMIEDDILSIEITAPT